MIQNRQDPPLLKQVHDFKRDALGRISEMYNESGRQQIHYDMAGRFVGRSARGATRAFSNFVYDQNGNRIRGHEDERTFTAEYDDQDRLIRYNNETFEYDANGHMVSRTEGDSTTTYAFDSFGNLRTVTFPNKAIYYEVDALNRRLFRMKNWQIVNRYVWLDQLRLGAELDADGKMVKQFIYADSVNVPEHMIMNGRKYLFIKDHRGSVNMVVDSVTGEIKQQIKYSEFGEVLQDTNPGFQPFGFAGGLYDYETKLVRFGARDYDGKIGRWLSKDPIRFDGGTPNLYEYTFNDPVNFVDANGKNAFWAFAIFCYFWCGDTLGDDDDSAEPAKYDGPLKDEPRLCSL